MADDGVRQVLMHAALFPAFEEWLASRGLEVRCVGTFGNDDLPSWVVSPTSAALARFERLEADRRRGD